MKSLKKIYLEADTGPIEPGKMHSSERGVSSKNFVADPKKKNQDWSVGQKVDVGFVKGAEVIGNQGGEYYLKSPTSGNHYKFTPHKGLEKLKSLPPGIVQQPQKAASDKSKAIKVPKNPRFDKMKDIPSLGDLAKGAAPQELPPLPAINPRDDDNARLSSPRHPTPLKVQKLNPGLNPGFDKPKGKLPSLKTLAKKAEKDVGKPEEPVKEKEKEPEFKPKPYPKD